jgi:hypothetical protein
MDASYSNYPQRIEYCKFLEKTDKTAKALLNLEALMAEWKDMTRPEKNLNRGLNTEIRKLYNRISNN